MNGRAVLALPHSGIAGDAADRAADAYAAAVRVDRAAVYIFNFRTIFHLEIGTLQPDRTCGANLALGFSFGAVCYCGILNYTAFCHNKLCLVGNADSRHAAEVAEDGTLAQSDGAGHSGVRGDNSILDIDAIVDLAFSTDGLGKYIALMLAAIVKNDVRQRQAALCALLIALNFNHGGVIPTAGSIA